LNSTCVLDARHLLLQGKGSIAEQSIMRRFHVVTSKVKKIVGWTVGRQKALCLVEEPRITGTSLSIPNVVDELLTEFETPLPHRFIGDDNAACSK
jgi:hypothetical protein